MESMIAGFSMSDGLNKDEVKEALKSAIKEWMNERFSEFGKWSLGGIMAGALGLLAYLILLSNGWHK